jgi:hypothetical protein
VLRQAQLKHRAVIIIHAADRSRAVEIAALIGDQSGVGIASVIWAACEVPQHVLVPVGGLARWPSQLEYCAIATG